MTAAPTLLDAAMPSLNTALDIASATPALRTALADASLSVQNATLVRHKPGRRAMIAYDISSAYGPRSMLGKVRAKGLDQRAHRIQRDCWQAGIAVPQPLGVVPAFQMVLQQRETGVLLTTLLASSDGLSLAARTADLLATLHAAPATTDRSHDAHDELHILHAQLLQVIAEHPHWHTRITRLLTNCERLASHLTSVPATTIHRDFYADQVLVDTARDRLLLLDLDLVSRGDPALDIGNAVAHITEQALREHGDPRTLIDREKALIEAFLRHHGSTRANDVSIWTRLSLVRHIAISNRMPERRHVTEALLDLCEVQLSSGW